VPAEVTGTGLRSFHNAAANCERAELCVHTNTTRGTRNDPTGPNPLNASARNRK
jgi:hypothetical protein